MTAGERPTPLGVWWLPDEASGLVGPPPARTDRRMAAKAGSSQAAPDDGGGLVGRAVASLPQGY